jgi:hypothetical protein
MIPERGVRQEGQSKRRDDLGEAAGVDLAFTCDALSCSAVVKLVQIKAVGSEEKRNKVWVHGGLKCARPTPQKSSDFQRS